MNSAGNDIVALKKISKFRSIQVGFYSKILSVAEQELFYRGDVADMPFENFLWLLWSIKESAYKYLKRKTPLLVFSPTRIIIQDIQFPKDYTVTSFIEKELENTGSFKASYKGKVLIESHIFNYSSIIHDELIYTIVNNDESFKNVWWGIRFTGYIGSENQSKSVRQFIMNKLNSLFPEKSLQIGKSPFGHPVVLMGTEEIDIPISFTHHDQFTAYSFMLKN